MTMIISQIILGILLLFAGKKLFWLSVGIIGFLAGIDFAAYPFPYNGWLVLGVGLLLGIAGSVFAFIFQWAAISLIGFLGGGYFLMNIFPLLGMQSSWIVFLVGGTIGVIVITLSFDGVLIIISSMVGGILIAQNIPTGNFLQTVVLIVSVIVGIVAQSAYPESLSIEKE